ncbi:hypothetical protein AB751O23_AH_00020 [Chlamydiales bacterium SCGC AB-751-O23]|nr:hypothetical protein AB751O23_AH_00020 [Chlamydiales bacterium SCGC AB-751-O23]
MSSNYNFKAATKYILSFYESYTSKETREFIEKHGKKVGVVAAVGVAAGALIYYSRSSQSGESKIQLVGREEEEGKEDQEGASVEERRRVEEEGNLARQTSEIPNGLDIEPLEEEGAEELEVEGTSSINTQFGTELVEELISNAFKRIDMSSQEKRASTPPSSGQNDEKIVEGIKNSGLGEVQVEEKGDGLPFFGTQPEFRAQSKVRSVRRILEEELKEISRRRNLRFQEEAASLRRAEDLLSTNVESAILSPDELRDIRRTFIEVDSEDEESTAAVELASRVSALGEDNLDVDSSLVVVDFPGASGSGSFSDSHLPGLSTAPIASLRGSQSDPNMRRKESLKLEWMNNKYSRLISGFYSFFHEEKRREGLSLERVRQVCFNWKESERVYSANSQCTVERKVPGFVDGILSTLDLLEEESSSLNCESRYKEFWRKFSDDVLANPTYQLLLGLQKEIKEKGRINAEFSGIKIQSGEELELLLGFSHLVSYSVFNGVRMGEFMDDLMRDVLEKSHNHLASLEVLPDGYIAPQPIASRGDLAERVSSDFLALDKLPQDVDGASPTKWIQKMGRNLLGHVDFWFEPLRMTNFVQLLYSRTYETSSGVSKMIKFFRFGSPTMTPLNGGEPTIEPMLKGLLNLYKKVNSKHGYFNFQSTVEKYKIAGDETARVFCIKNLTQEYPENFLFFSFPMDSELWKLNGDAKTSSKVGEFIKLIAVNFFKKGKEACFDYPDLLPGESKNKNDRAAKNFFYKTIEPLRAFFGGDEATLNTPEGKKAFLFLAYIALHSKFCEYFELDSANAACKDAIDRAGSFIVLSMYLEMMHEKGEALDDDAMNVINEKIRLLSNAFPFLVKSQAIVKCRRGHFMAGLDCIDQKYTEARDFMKQLRRPSNMIGVGAEESKSSDVLGNSSLVIY